MRPLRSILLAGGAGFVGSSLARHLLAREEVARLVVLDPLLPSSNRANLAGPDQDPRFTLVEGVIGDQALVGDLLERHEVTGVFNLAATEDPERAIETSVTGTARLLDSCRAAGVPLLQCSSSAVYGSVAPPGRFLETDPLAPSSQTAALQASADLLCQAASAAHQQEVLITRASQTYGPRQAASQLIPTLVRHGLAGDPVALPGGGMSLRDWIHVDDHCRGLLAAFLRGRAGHVYNLGGNCERTTIGVARSILQILDKPETLLTKGPERPGHDLRRTVDNTKALGFLGWAPQLKMAGILPSVVRAIAADLEALR